MTSIAPTSACLRPVLFAVLCIVGLSVPALAQEDDGTRSVHILDQPAVPVPVPGPADAAAAPTPSELAIANQSFQIDNSAGVTLEILPGTELQVGSNITFRVATKRRGYLILVDIDAAGKLTQIYPNPMAIRSPAAHEALNLINPGRTVTVPDATNPFAGFEYVASPPPGAAMVVAILSDRPVQLLDLPDVPPQLAGREGALNYVRDLTRRLRITRPDDPGHLQEAKWSFDAKLYLIR